MEPTTKPAQPHAEDDCEICALHGVKTPAIRGIWLHRALGNTDCRLVAVCGYCIDQGIVTEVDPGCKDCCHPVASVTRNLADPAWWEDEEGQA